MSVTPVVFGPLRAAGANGHTKDWVAVALADRLVIGYGRTGQVPRRSEVPLSQCRQSNSQTEGHLRMLDKHARGYAVCSQPTARMRAFIETLTGGRGSTATAAPTPAPTAPADTAGLFWEMIPTTPLDGAVQEVLDILAGLVTIASDAVSGAAPTGLQIVVRLSEVSAESIALACRPPARSGGCATTPVGQLLLTALHARLPAGQLRLATATGTELDARILLRQASWKNTEPYRTLIERLGLGLTLPVTATPVWFY